MAAVDFFTAFGYQWAQDGSVYNWDDNQYKQGWATIGSVPPSVEQFNRVHQVLDQKANWLFAQLQVAATARGITLAATDLDGLLKVLNISTVGRLLGVRIFDAVGTYTYTPTQGTTKIRVRVVGGGGGGGAVANATASNFAAAAGGAAGAYAESILASGFAGQTVVVGAGGAGGTSGGAGGAGNTSSFGSILSASGGGGGLGGGTPTTTVRSIGGGIGGTAIGGQINAQGNGGGTAIMTGTQGYQSGVGAGSFFGGGANSRRAEDSGAGMAGNGPGAGGSGAALGGVGGAGASPGGAGAAGIVIIEEFA